MKRLNQQVNRNRERFPCDFMFRLTPREFAALMLQFATSNKEFADRIKELEKHLETHDGTIQEIIDVIKKLMSPPRSRRNMIGFALPPTRTG